MTTPTQQKNTQAFFAQAALSFAVALGGMVIAICYLPADPWTRAFLAIGTIFTVTSSFTLAKCVRDAQENGTVISRLDQARLERLLAEFDPYATTGIARAAAKADRQGEQHDPQQYPNHAHPRAYGPPVDQLAI